MIVNTRTAQEAADLLRLPLSEVTEQTVAAAYKARARQTHPDMGGSLEAFAQVDRAKHLLLEWLRRQSPPAPPAGHKQKCDTCAGKGYLMQMRGIRSMRVMCPGCRGTGEMDVEQEKGDQH